MLEAEESSPASAPSAGNTESTSSGCEQLVLRLNEVFIYKIPPLRASSGYRAEEWDLANPLLTGSLRAYQKDMQLYLRLYESRESTLLGGNQPLFAQCHIRLGEDEGGGSGGKILDSFVDTVVDSSRYFVIKCEDEKSKRHAFLGIGFRERQDAFDLKAVLSDFVQYTSRSKLAEKRTMMQQQQQQQEGEEASCKGGEIMGNHLDLSLKEGEKLKLIFFHRGHEGDEEKGETIKKHHHHHHPANVGSTNILLPPPPGGRGGARGLSPGKAAASEPNIISVPETQKKQQQQQADDQQQTEAQDVSGNDEWGDFVG